MKDMAVADVANIWRYNIFMPFKCSGIFTCILSSFPYWSNKGSLAFKTAAWILSKREFTSYHIMMITLIHTVIYNWSLWANASSFVKWLHHLHNILNFLWKRKLKLHDHSSGFLLVPCENFTISSNGLHYLSITYKLCSWQAIIVPY
jgi:hypothetical protein